MKYICILAVILQIECHIGVFQVSPSILEDVHVRGLPSYLLQRGVGIAVIDSDESCLPIIRKVARTCPVAWRPES